MSGKRRKAGKNQIQRFMRSTVTTLAKTAADTGGYITVTPSSLPGINDILSLFQKYKLVKISWTFTLTNAPNNNSNFPTLWWAPQQYANSGVPSSRDEVLQFQGVRSHQFGPSNLAFTITVKPYATIDAFGIGSAGVIPYPWVANSVSSVPAIGMVYWLSRYSTVPADSSHNIEVTTRVWLDAHGTR